MANVFTSNNFRVAAATPFAAVAAGAAFVAEVSALAGKKIAGKENWGKVPFSGYVEKHTRGFVFNVPSVEEALKEVEAKEVATTPQTVSRRENHSPNVVLNKDGFWEPKEAGKGVASLYKAANKARMVLVAGKKWEDVPSYPDKEGNFLNLAGWTLHGIRQHAEWREKEGDEGVWTPKVLKGYLSQVLRLSADPEEVKGKKLPSFEELVRLSGEEWASKVAPAAPKAAPATQIAPAKATPVPAQEVEVPVEDDGLPRDGGAPGQAAPAPASVEAVRTFTTLIKVLHLGRITEGNAITKAKAVAAAYEAGTINAAELDSLRKAIEKKFKGDQEQLEAAFAA